ncbi:hypothetical protein BIW11_09628 [Tropilaelaps mercedesae]|uniref:Cuticle protein 14-like n=1 Tax=Tropilaelaps mercedesae TaxID=418985 RepID=A0A1V9XJE7_9ACAR|nr:hypothetical protein BIW11_09628 [Tropilaelaps mercedesae]
MGLLLPTSNGRYEGAKCLPTSEKLRISQPSTSARRAFITFTCALAVARAGVVAPKVHEEGTSVQYRSEDGLGNYQFGYDEKHTTGGSFRKEKGDGYGRKVGSYGLHDADGRVRVVNYVADEHGFRASVQSNEPGVAPEDPAASSINKAPVPIPYSAPMHLDHVTGVNVGLAHSVAAPVVSAYSAPAYSGPVVAPIGFYRQPMHFTSVLGPSVSHMIGQMPAYIGSFLATQAAHPLHKTVAYSAPIAAPAPVAVPAPAVAPGAAYAAPVSALAPAFASGVHPVPSVAYKAPMHFAGVVGPSVSHMLNQYLPQHLAGQKFFKQLHSPAVHYEAEPIVTGLDVAPAAPVAAVAAPVVGKSLAVTAAPAVAPVAAHYAPASYVTAPVVEKSYASYSAAPVVEKAYASYATAPLPAPISTPAFEKAYAPAPVVAKAYAPAPVVAKAYAPAPVAVTTGPVVKAGYASYAAAPLPARISTPIIDNAYTAAPVIEKPYAAPVVAPAPYSAPISAAPVGPIVGNSVAYSAPATPILSKSYAAAPVAAPLVEKQIAYGAAPIAAAAAPVVEKAYTSYAAAPVVAAAPIAAAAPIVEKAYVSYAAAAAPVAAPITVPVAKAAVAAPALSYTAQAGYGPTSSYTAHLGKFAAAAPTYAAPVAKLAVAPTYAAPVAKLAVAPAYAAPVYAPAPVAKAASSNAYSPVPIVAAPVTKVGVVSSGISTTTANANGYSHELVKPHAYTKVYQWMYGHSPSFYGYAYSPVPLGYRKK